MFVYIYMVIAAIAGQEVVTHALVYAVCVQDAEALLKQAGILSYEEDPVAVFAQPEYIEPCVILERSNRKEQSYGKKS